MKNRKTVHSKIYRTVMPDGTVKLVQGSANLSRNPWEYHTNQISVITTDVGTELDEEFERFIDEYREGYSDQTLLEGVVEALEDADSPEERENRIEYWVGAGDLDVSDTAALNQDAVEDLKYLFRWGMPAMTSILILGMALFIIEDRILRLLMLLVAGLDFVVTPQLLKRVARSAD